MQNMLIELITKLAEEENISLKKFNRLYKQGKIVIPNNPRHKNLKPCAIGQGTRVKINANIGMSPTNFNEKDEIKKVEICKEYGADAVMDLSVGGDSRPFRRLVVEKSPMPVGTVPIYDAINEVKKLEDLTMEDYLRILRRHGEDGIDFVTIHAGLRRKQIPAIEKRLIKTVSRGGGFIYKWMKLSCQENLLYKYFDEILKVCKEFNMTISLGDGLRPGCIADNTDAAQIGELKELGKLVLRCRKAGVQAMVEGPGHVPINMIKKNVELQKKYCHGAPFYVLGPLVTDIAPGYDHITSAIGGAIAASYGVDFLCYVTPAEHLRLPTLDEVREGIIASKIAAHAADLARGNKQALARDRELSLYRQRLDWKNQKKFVLDPVKFEKLRDCKDTDLKSCTMCGEWCPILLNQV
ncbi:MAG: phosphomethylpyrimidine synthase ThiC [Candidatus Margulisbacteria bacterium]|nr:phosphomethylpyrimidine synthase ThiC [Candidatus Margulisiibacteriota bacterium]